MNTNMTTSTLTNNQMRAMYRILLVEYGYRFSGEQLRHLSKYYGFEITNWKQITFEMASKFLGEHLRGGEQNDR